MCVVSMCQSVYKDFTVIRGFIEKKVLPTYKYKGVVGQKEANNSDLLCI